MSELPISSPYRSTPGAPVTEAEREQLTSRLNAAFEAGTLEAEDYHARLDRLFAARALGELVPVVQGLPPLQTYADPAIVTDSGGEPGRLAQTRDASRLALVTVGVLVSVVLLIALLLILL
ncbi:MAG: DUF1707 domain-containing protein [Actinomycetes bacterium]